MLAIAGVGPVAALSFEVGVDASPALYAISHRRSAFWPDAGRHQSGTSIDYVGRFTKQDDIAVREALCEAAASLLLRVRKWSALRALGTADCQTVKYAV